MTWADIDLERGIVSINKSVDRETGEVTTTKGEEARKLPIEGELLPMFGAVKEEQGGEGT